MLISRTTLSGQRWFIVLTGRRLDPLRLALCRGQATFIQQWSSKVWQTPATAGEPLVKSIEFVSLGG